MKHKSILPLFVGVLVVFVFWSSCKKDNLENLLGNGNGNATCDTAFVVSYKNDIVPILENKHNGVNSACYNCHDVNNYQGRGTVRLDAYEFLIPKATEDNLLCRIKHLSTCPPMPQDGRKLSDCNIARIEAWINQGAPNN